MRRLLWLLTIALVFSFAPAGAGAEDAHACGENLVWSLDGEGLLTISGTGEMKSYFEDKPPWGHMSVRRIVMEPGVTSVGALAFEGCLRLKSVEIPDTVVSVGDYAFDRCTSLESIALPDGIREVGINPFSGCTSLKEIILSPDHPVLSFRDGILFGRQDHRLICRAAGDEAAECVIPAGILTVGDYAFSECASLKSVIVPEGVTSIGRCAFRICESLLSVDLPASLTSVGDYAFSRCECLKSVTLREGLRSIGTGAFNSCGNLEELALPGTLEELGDSPFRGCRSLSRIGVSAEHSYLAFENGFLFSKPDGKLIFCAVQNPEETCLIPEGIRIIGQRAFGNGGGLKRIVLPESVREIEKEGFDGCRAVEEIVFSPGLETIGAGAFYDMYRVEELTLPDGLRSIGDEAFGGCAALKSILIPGSVETLGKAIFAGVDTLNLAVFVPEGSAAERFCLENGLRAVHPGQEIPGPETDLPAAFTEAFPGYKGLCRMETERDNQFIYLTRRPDEALVLLCGYRREDGSWSVVESAALPAESAIILYDGLQMLDLGYARCTVRRYHDDVWGIDCLGWNDTFIGPRWVGTYGPPTRYFGVHPWGDLRTIRWISLDESLDALRKGMDVSAFAVPAQEDPEGRTPIYESPDSGSRQIAQLRNGAPLFVAERNEEWTRVSLGRDDGGTWKLEGWIRTAELAFGEEADSTLLTDPDYSFTPGPMEVFPFITPEGCAEIQGPDYISSEWCVLGDGIIDGQKYWLVYHSYTEQLGFIPARR